MVATQYDLSFRVDRDRSLLCKKTFKQDELKEFQKVRQRAAPAALYRAEGQPVVVLGGGARYTDFSDFCCRRF